MGRERRHVNGTEPTPVTGRLVIIASRARGGASIRINVGYRTAPEREVEIVVDFKAVGIEEMDRIVADIRVDGFVLVLITTDGVAALGDLTLSLAQAAGIGVLDATRAILAMSPRGHHDADHRHRGRGWVMSTVTVRRVTAPVVSTVMTSLTPASTSSGIARFGVASRVSACPCCCRSWSLRSCCFRRSVVA